MRIRRMGEVYSAGDCVVTLAGMFDIDPSEISYSYKYAHEYQRGLKREPRGWRMGAKEMEAKMKLPLDIMTVVEKAAKLVGGDIAKIKPFPVNITILNDENETVHDYLLVKFTGNGRNITGEDGLEYEFELFVLDMKLNVI